MSSRFALACVLAPWIIAAGGCGTSSTEKPDASPSDDGGDAGVTGSTLGDDTEAIALDGKQLPKLLQAAPAAIAAFRFDGATFTEVPVQVDPRAVLPFSAAMSSDDSRAALASEVTTSFYTGSNSAPGGQTFVDMYLAASGAGNAFDDDDELAVLARDFGAAAPSTATPPNVDAATRTELHASHAGDSARSGYLYLFVRTSAPTTFPPEVTMNVSFVGQTGNFVDFYHTAATNQASGTAACGAAKWGVIYPEDTTITGSTYERHFSGRWLSDALKLGGGSQPNVLDIAEVRPGYAILQGAVATTTASPLPDQSHACDRSVTSFSGGPGTIVTLRSGPIRAIRSYYGANSGTITERTHIFYPAKEDVFTFLRVHPIPGATDGMDLSSAAIGMTYYNDHNLGGLAIDGKPDVYDSSAAAWEMVTGANQGTLLTVMRGGKIDLGSETAAFAPKTMFLDDSAAPTCVCSGSDQAFLGAHGPFIFDNGALSLPNTDPLRGDAAELYFAYSLYFTAGATSTSDATAHASSVTSLVVAIDGASPIDPFAVTCGDGVCEVDETSANCPSDCPALPGAGYCGDGTCVDGEAFLCTKDCPYTGHGTYFSCLSNQCNTDYFSCGSDPGCSTFMTCLEGCSGAYTSCNASCSAAVTDPQSLDLAKKLGACGKTPCTSSF